jgi:cell filamentation protein
VAFVDPYIDQTTGLLRNLLGATTDEELAEREAQIVFANQLELESVSIPRTNDFSEVLLIHEQLFKDVYEWAGRIRTVDIKKSEEGAEFFLIVSKITDAANYVFGELAKESYLKGLDKTEFTQRLAHHYDQLNYIHPFREGNGRVQRVFWARVAKEVGYEIDWDAVMGGENDEASRLAAEEMDLSALEKMFDRIVFLAAG